MSILRLKFTYKTHRESVEQENFLKRKDSWLVMFLKAHVKETLTVVEKFVFVRNI